MSTLGTTNLTLADHAKRMDPDGKTSKIVEILNQTNDLIKEMAWQEGNLPTGHLTTVRTGLPTATWRMLNYGVQPTKSRTVQVTDTCGMLEARSEVDVDLVKLNADQDAFRLSEASAFIESMNQAFMSTFFYGDTDVDPERFLGLSARYSTAAAANAANAQNVIDGGSGTASVNTSIWLVVWGENTVHGIYPKGSKAGLEQKDLGEQTVLDADQGRFQALAELYKWKCGLTLRDWRYVVRIPNIKGSTLVKGAGSGSDLITLMIKALHQIPNLSAGRAAFYCNRTIETWLDLQTLNQANNFLKYGPDVHGMPVMQFRGIPVRRCDALLNTEELVPLS